MSLNDLDDFAEYNEFALSPSAIEPHVTLDIPPQLVWECAAGLENPTDVAARFGFTGAKWERLQQWPPFINAVQAQRAEFERNGMTFRLKAGLMAEEMMSQMFKQAISNDSTILQKLSVFNSLVDVAGLKPDKKAVEANVQTAPKFSITINIPQAPGPTPVTIDG
jgi:hypothetical protein